MELVNLSNRPLVLTMSSQYSQSPTKSNSDATFNMSETLSPRNASAVGLISLLGFRCKNVFYNISQEIGNNLFKLSTIFYDNTNLTSFPLPTTTITNTFTVPDGYYDIDKLLLLMNTEFVNVTNGIYTTFASTINFPAYYYGDGFSNLLFAVYPQIYSQTTALVDNSFVLQSIEIVVDSTTLPFLKLLGYAQNTLKQTNSISTIASFSAYADSNDGTSYTFSGSNFTTDSILVNNILVPNYSFFLTNFYDMQYVTSIFVSLENTVSQNRATFDNLSQTDFLFRISIPSTFGSDVNFLATLEQKSYVTNINLNNIRITIKDVNGNSVDFRGTNWECDIGIKFGMNEEGDNKQAVDLNIQNSQRALFEPQSVLNTVGKQQDVLFPKRRRLNFSTGIQPY